MLQIARFGCDRDLKGSALQFCCALKRDAISQIARFESAIWATLYSDLHWDGFCGEEGGRRCGGAPNLAKTLKC